MSGYMGYMIIAGVFTLIGWMVSSRLKSKFNQITTAGFPHSDILGSTLS